MRKCTMPRQLRKKNFLTWSGCSLPGILPNLCPKSMICIHTGRELRNDKHFRIFHQLYTATTLRSRVDRFGGEERNGSRSNRCTRRPATLAPSCPVLARHWRPATVTVPLIQAPHVIAAGQSIDLQTLNMTFGFDHWINWIMSQILGDELDPSVHSHRQCSWSMKQPNLSKPRLPQFGEEPGLEGL